MVTPMDQNPIRLILLSQYFYPERNATAELLTALAVDLARHNVCVTVYAAQPTYFENADRVPSSLSFEGVLIRRLWSTRLGRAGWLNRILDAATFLSSVFIQLQLVSRGDILMAVTNPPLLPLLVAARRKLFGNPFLLIVHDLYPDVAVELGLLRRNGVLVGGLRVLDRFVLRQADAIVVIGRDMRDRLNAKLPSEYRGLVHVIPNWADAGQIVPVPKSTTVLAAHDGRLGDNFVVQYSGNVGLAQGLEVILEAADILRDDNVLFTIIGEGAKLGEMRQLAASRRLAHVIFLPRVDHASLSDSLAACDAALVPLDQKLVGCSVPSKFYGVLASGRPILAVVPSNSEVALSVEEYDCGLVVPPGDATDLVKAIRFLKANPRRAEELGRNAYTAFLQNHTREHAVVAYLDVIRGLSRAGRVRSNRTDSATSQTKPGPPSREL